MNALENYIQNNKNIILKVGSHKDSSCEQCILELCSAVLGKKWTDNPRILGLPDLRPLNDAHWTSDKIRTEQMLRVAVAIWPWRESSVEKKISFSRKLAELTIRRVLPLVLREANMPNQALTCEQEGTGEAAASAAKAASAVVAAVVADARDAYFAAAAARTAYFAARAATAADDAADELAEAWNEDDEDDAGDAATLAANSAAAAAARATDTAAANYAATRAATRAADTAAAASARAATRTADTWLTTACDCWVEAAKKLS